MGTCTTPGSCLPLNSTVSLESFTGTGTFNFGDNTLANPTGTITSINQAEDYATAVFTFNKVYTVASGPHTAFFLGTNRLSTLKLSNDTPEQISTFVQYYPNQAPVASVPAILAVPLLNTVTINLGSAVTDIDPNVNLVFRVATFQEMFGNTITNLFCPSPSNIAYKPGGVASGTPPGFTISNSGIVTWDTTQIHLAITNGNCDLAAPAAGDLWATQIMVEARDKTTNNLVTKIPIDLLMKFVTATGVLPTITLNPVGPQTVQIGTPVSFTATGNSTNSGAKVTLNASGVPVGAAATGLNSSVTPPATSNFSWTPAAGQDGTYVVTYTVTDSNLQQATASETIIVATPPTATCSAALTLPYNQAGQVSATVFDPNNEVLNVTWALDGTTVHTDNSVVAYPTPATLNLNQTYGAVGPHTLQVTATDPHGVNGICSTPVTITAADQTINFGPLSNVTYGAPDFNVSATATSGLMVLFGSSGNCTVSGNTVHITGAGSCTITATQLGDSNYNAAAPVPQSFNIGQAPLTVTAGSYSGVYDANPHSLSSCTVSANFDGLTCTNSPSGQVGPDVGSGTVTPVVSGATTNYSVTMNNGSWSITPLPVTVTGGSYSGVYDGSAHAPASCTSSYAGVTCANSPPSVGPDVGGAAVAPIPHVASGVATDYTVTPVNGSWSITPLSVTVTGGHYSGVYDGSAHVPSACTSSFAGVTCSNSPSSVGPDVGAGAITPGSSVVTGIPADYAITPSNGLWSITALAVTVTGGSYSGVYDGSAHSPTACTSSYVGVTCINAPTSIGPDVGAGAITPGSSVATGIPADYAITPANGSWSITPLTVTVTAGVYSGVYDGSAHAPTACTSSFAGVTCANSPASVGPDVGGAAVAPIPHVSSGIATDYTITPTNGSWSITALAVTVTGGSYSGVYDGSAHSPTACTSSYVGVTCANSPASVGPDVGAAAVAPIPHVTGGVAADYTITPTNGSWSITPLTVTVSAGVYSGVYDGSAHAPTACTSSYVDVTCANSPASVGPDVGGAPVTPIAHVASGIATDYTITPTNGSWSITPLTVTVKGGVYSGAYDGNAHAPSACTSSFAGVTCSNNPTSVGPNVGSGAITPGSSVATGSPADYTITPTNGSWSITPAPVTATAGSYVGLYDTLPHAPTGCLVSGSYTVGLSCTNSPALVGPGVSSGIITPGVTGLNGNFQLTSTVNGSWAIAPAPLVIAGNGSSQYSDPLSTSSVSVTGFRGTDTQANACIGSLSASTSVTPGSAPGQYSTNYSGLICPNYSLGSGAGSYSVTQEDSTLTYTGLQYFGVPATQTTVNVTLTYTVQDASVVQNPAASYYDTNPGDISNAVAAPVSITGSYVSGNGTMANYTGSCTPTGVVAAPGLTLTGSLLGTVPSTGTFTCSISLPVNGNFTAAATSGTGSYYNFSGGDTQVMIATSNGGAGLVTGGGYQSALYLGTNGNGTNGKYADSSSVMLMPASGTKMNYGFVAKFNKNASNLQGNVNIIIRSHCLAKGIGGSNYLPNWGPDGLCVYQIKGTNVSSMSDQPASSTKPGYGNVVSNAIITDVTWPTSQPVMGGGTTQLEMYDNQSGNSGTTPDTLGIQVTDNKGKVWFSNNWNGATLKTVTATASPQIQGGNVTAH